VTGEQSQQWMRRRVMFQAIAIVLVVLILAIAGTASR
jgi:type II secretory pathway component PulL